MNNKLKELSRYCCKPANEQGYEFVKTCARLGGVEWNPYGEDKYLESGKFKYVQLTHIEAPYLMAYYKDSLIEIPVTQFCDILLKDEREFEFKPKVGEWCVKEWKDNDEHHIFLVERIYGVKIYDSKYLIDGKKQQDTGYACATTDDFRYTLRQPTPEEIQTAIDAWDDRVDIDTSIYSVYKNVDISKKKITARDGYKFRLSEDCKTVELVKDEVKCGFCVKPKNEK